MPPKTLILAGIGFTAIAVLLSAATSWWMNIPASEYVYNDAGTLIQCACFFLGATGTLLALRGLRLRLQEILAGKPTLRIFPEMVMRSVLPLQRHRPMPPMKDFPNFGLFCGYIFLILMFIFMILRNPLTSHGLLVNFGEQNALVRQKSPWSETVGVYVDHRRTFYVNGHPVPREELRTKLGDELGKRMVWDVYFEADSDALYMDAVYSIDTIQGLGAKAVWITPKIREELDRQTAR